MVLFRRIKMCVGERHRIGGRNMESILESLMVLIAKSHSYILSLNDAYEKSFTDKELHFLVIGLIGMALVLVIYPLFKLLSRNHVLVIVFIYVFKPNINHFVHRHVNCIFPVFQTVVTERIAFRTI